MKLGTIVIGAVASLGFVAFVGAVILWSRFEAAELPADQAVAVQPREDLVTVGAIALVLFVLGGLLAVLVLWLLDHQGRASSNTRIGLLVVILLEILAAFFFEQWDGTAEWLPLVFSVFVGLAAVGGLLQLASRRRGRTRDWACAALCLAAVTIAAAVLVNESIWIAWIALIALALGAVNLAIARVTGEHFVWYGASVFLSVALFGAAFSLVRALEDPQAHGLAILRTNDISPVCGIYVAETDDRLYYARVDLKGTRDVRELRPDSGRLLWVPRDRLVSAEIGPLEPIDAAQSTALDLRQEIAVNREPPERGRELPRKAEARTAEARLTRSATGADPCGPQPNNVEQSSTPAREMAERFQPRLRMSKNDGFWPISLLTIFELKRRGEVLCREPGCVPVRSQADLPFAGGETQWLEYPGPYDSRDQQRRQVIRALGGTEDPYRTAREYFLMTKGDSGTTSLQYWFFYPFNYQPLRVPGLKAGYHEGDFEHVDVLVSRDGEPRMVWMARHDDEDQPFLWNESALKQRGQHVDIFPAKGSHASYDSCLEKARPKAPLGLINDRPECKSTEQFVLEPGQVPLFELSRARWACWAGRFGHIASTSNKEWKLYEANGPQSPLWQQRSRGKDGKKPCEDLTPPQNLVSEGEEPLDDDTAATIASRADRLDPLLDRCDDWWRPQPQGAYLAACQPEGLARWMKDGLGPDVEPRLRVLAPPLPTTKLAWPLAVRRDASVPTFRKWRIRSEQKARITVYAACLARQRPIEATFAGQEIVAGRELRVDDRTDGTWRLMDGSQVVDEATPRLAGETKDGPNAPSRRPPPSTICSAERR